MTKIVLDADAFKALASDTRLDILKALDVRRLTVTEVARVLELNKATVFEHLKQLQTADLVKKDDEGRKWIYYRLTWKGKNVLHPENAQIFLMLGMAALGVGGAVAALGTALRWFAAHGAPLLDAATAPQPPQGDETAADGEAPSAGQAPEAERQISAPGPPASDDASAGDDSSLLVDPWFWVFLVLMVASALVILLAWTRYRARIPVRREIRRRLQAQKATT